MNSVAEISHAAGSLLVNRSSRLVPELKRYLKEHGTEVEALIDAGDLSSGSEVGERYCRLYDALLSTLFDACRAVTGAWTGLCLGAVGSYGRRVLSPKSDLDVRVLCAGDASAAESLTETLLYPLWDAGLDLGHQVVTPQGLVAMAKSDLTSATALLDWRPLAGDLELGERLEQLAFQELFAESRLGDFADRLASYNARRHARYGDSVYLLEPDVKNGTGGLRDLDIAHWCARAGFRVETMSDLVELDLFLPSEWQEITVARDYLLGLRNALHRAVGRKSDRLTFDLQEVLAERFGYGSGGLAVERLMSDYYRHARTIRQTCDRMLASLRPVVETRGTVRPLQPGIIEQGGAVSLSRPKDLEADPSLALAVYAQAIAERCEVSDTTRQAICRAAAADEFGPSLRRHPNTPRLFRELVCVVQEPSFGAGSVLGELHDVGLLLAVMPEFEPVVGRVHNDTYHVYTVDVHSIAAVDHLRQLCRGDLSDDHPLACRLAAETSRREVLFLATLLHDVGKVFGGVGHAERGAEMATEILGRLGFGADEIRDVQLLIRQHLRMYHIATKRDLEDPRTQSDLTAEVGNQELLRELYLLTVADVTTTSPKSMTRWKRNMLDELYVKAERYLQSVAGSESSPHTHEAKERIMSAWGETGDAKFLGNFLSGLPERYFFANDGSAVLEHARFAHLSQEHIANVRIGNRKPPYVELWVVADDKPGLLAAVAAAFRRKKLRVLSAQVYSWSHAGRARTLDVFWVRQRSGEEFSESDLGPLRRELEQLVTSELVLDDLDAPSSVRPGALPRIETCVNVDNGTATNCTVIEVITRDRPYLLFRLTMTLQQMGLSIWFAKINTEGDKVADVFYVSDGQEGKVTDPVRLEDIRLALMTAADSRDFLPLTALSA